MLPLSASAFARSFAAFDPVQERSTYEPADRREPLILSPTRAATALTVSGACRLYTRDGPFGTSSATEGSTGPFGMDQSVGAGHSGLTGADSAK